MTIEERLENMEREMGRQKRHNRWLLAVILLLVGGLVAAATFKTTVTLAQAQGEGTAAVIRAKAFVVEDESGKTSAGLSSFQDGPRLSLFDGNAKERVGLSIFKDGPRLELRDENGLMRAGLSVFKDGPGLTLYDEGGKDRVVLSVFKDGLGLRLSDENGNSRTVLGVFKNGPALRLSDENGIIRFQAGKTAIETPDGKTIEYPESSLILYGSDGKVIWSTIK